MAKSTTQQAPFILSDEKVTDILKVFNRSMDTDKTFNQMKIELTRPSSYILVEFDSPGKYQDFLDSESPERIAEFIAEFFW